MLSDLPNYKIGSVAFPSMTEVGSRGAGGPRKWHGQVPQKPVASAPTTWLTSGQPTPVASRGVPQTLETEGGISILAPAGSACCADPRQCRVSSLLVHLGTLEGSGEGPPSQRAQPVAQGWEASCIRGGYRGVQSLTPFMHFPPNILSHYLVTTPH